MASFSNNFRGRESDDDNLDDSDNEEKQEKQSDLKKICKFYFSFILQIHGIILKFLRHGRT